MMEKDSVHNHFGGLLTLEQIEKLPTHRIVAYFKKKRGLEHSGKVKIAGKIMAKSKEDAIANQAAVDYFNGIRKILKGREHVD